MTGPAVERRKGAVRRVTSKELIAARTRQRHTKAGGADSMRHVIGIEAVETRLVLAIERRLQVLNEMCLRQHNLVVPGADGGGDPFGDRAFIELLLLEGQGESVDGA